MVVDIYYLHVFLNVIWNLYELKSVLKTKVDPRRFHFRLLRSRSPMDNAS